MFTLGYSFQPWTEPKAIADGPRILNYVRETAAENGIDRKIRFHHRVKRASWSSQDARWTVEAERGGPGEARARDRALHLQFPVHVLRLLQLRRRLSRRNFPGEQNFAGRIVHPQKWPDDLDYAGKRVVVIGSGATAVTLVPEMAKTGGACHHAAALADLCGVAPGGGSARQQAARKTAAQARLSPDPLAQRAVRDVFLPAVPAQAGARQAN